MSAIDGKDGVRSGWSILEGDGVLCPTRVVYNYYSAVTRVELRGS